MKQTKSILLRFLCCAAAIVLAAEWLYSAEESEITVEEFVKARMERDRSKQRAVRENFGPLLNADPNRAFEALAAYKDDPSDKIRVEMLRNLMRVKDHHNLPDLHGRIVSLMLNAYSNAYDERSRYVRRKSAVFLGRFPASVFDADAKALIRKAFREKGVSRDTLELYSIANMKEDLPELKKVFEAREWPPDDPEDELWPRSLKWKFRRVMAQFGDEESIAYCVSRVANEKRPAVKAKAMLSLEKVRHPDVVRLMAKCLESDLRVDGGHGMSWPVSACAVQVLAGMLDNFPVKKKSAYPMHTESETAQCRKWMLERTEWKFKEF